MLKIKSIFIRICIVALSVTYTQNIDVLTEYGLLCTLQVQPNTKMSEVRASIKAIYPTLQLERFTLRPVTSGVPGHVLMDNEQLPHNFHYETPEPSYLFLTRIP